MLLQDWHKNRDSEACKPDFYLIRAVTLVEVFTRRNIAALIDHDRRYSDRSVDLTKTLKIDFTLVREIQGRTITLGDILSHSVSVNTFGQIIDHFSLLLGKPVRPLLEVVVDRYETEVHKKPATPIVDDYAVMARCLARLFEARHIICHEAPRGKVYEPGELDEFLRRAIQLASGLHEILMFEKFGHFPLTQTDMNIAAGQELVAAEERLSRLLSEAETRVEKADKRFAELKLSRNDGDTWLAHLKDSQATWLAYRNAQCEFHTYLNRGGTIRPLVWANEAKRLTEMRISDVESWLKQDSER